MSMAEAEHDNLNGLHGEEELLRAESLALIEKNDALKDHYRLVAEAMNLVFAFTNQHEHIQFVNQFHARRAKSAIHITRLATSLIGAGRL
jgi:hypothetical protein